MKVIFLGQVAKDSCFPEAIEDAFALDMQNGRLAVSDGASESFDSKTWARLIAEGFVQSPKACREWINALHEMYTSLYDIESLSWSKLAAYERGSFATLLGIEEFSTHGSVDILAIGDSLAVLLNGERCIDTFSYRSAAEFSQRPDLISTNSSQNDFVEASDFFRKHSVTWSLNEYPWPVILCMTDALAQWAMFQAEQGMPAWSTLVNFRHQDEFEKFVARERLAKSMRVDDVTLISLSFETEDSHELSKS